MGDYDLNRMGPGEFEDMAVALFMDAHGLTDPLVFGRGKDGGRELTTRADLTIDGRVWSGYTVVQVKHRQRPRDPQDNLVWIRNEIRKEITLWTKPKSPRSPKPDNLIVISNVVLSAAQGGGVDSIGEIFTGHPRPLPLVNRSVWAFDHVSRLLDQSSDIRRAYSGLITPGDVLSSILDVVHFGDDQLPKTMRRNLAKDLAWDRWTRLGKAGSHPADRISLGVTAIDLESRDQRAGTKVETAAFLMSHFDAVWSRSQISLRDLSRSPAGTGRDNQPFVNVVGQPGQGKSTIGQVLCQAYRAALVGREHELGKDVDEILDELRPTLSRLQLDKPSNRRWPFYIELNKFAEFAMSDNGTLLNFIAKSISDRSDYPLTAAQLASWRRQYPWFLVLDGLDEVPSPEARQAITTRLSDFLVDANADDADVAILTTTRPQGYAGEFDRPSFFELRLVDLTSSRARSYGHILATHWHAEDPQIKSNVLARLDEAAHDDLTARLMKSPLQVAIMSRLLEDRERVPQSRFSLFDAYLETIYARETNRASHLGKLLEEHKPRVLRLHEQVGLLIQVTSEDARRSDPSISQEALFDLVIEDLRLDEYEETVASKLAANIVKSATDRLVLLVPREDKNVGFEVRSLQEFMAARAITTGRDDVVLGRLRATSTSAHWRNVWLLATGRIASSSTQGHLIDDLLGQVRTEDFSSTLTTWLRPSIEVARGLVDDRFDHTSPKTLRILLSALLPFLSLPPTGGTRDTCRSVAQLADVLGAESLISIKEACTIALRSDASNRITGLIALDEWSRSGGTLASFARQQAATHKMSLNEQVQVAVHMNPRAGDVLEGDMTLRDCFDWDATGLSGSSSDLLATVEELFGVIELHTAKEDTDNAPVLQGIQGIGFTTINDLVDDPVASERLRHILAKPKNPKWTVQSAGFHLMQTALSSRQIARRAFPESAVSTEVDGYPTVVGA